MVSEARPARDHPASAAAVTDRVASLAAYMRAIGAPVGVGEVVDAHRALAAVDPAVRREAYFALRAALCSSRADYDRFAEAFAIVFAPGDPFITDSLGWVEFRLGNRAEALRILQGAYKDRPDPEIAAHLGEVLWSLGEREQAEKIWRDGMLLHSDNDTLQETVKRLKVKQ